MKVLTALLSAVPVPFIRARAKWRSWRESSRQYQIERAIYRAQQQVQQHEDARHFAPGQPGMPFAGGLGGGHGGGGHGGGGHGGGGHGGGGHGGH